MGSMMADDDPFAIVLGALLPRYGPESSYPNGTPPSLVAHSLDNLDYTRSLWRYISAQLCYYFLKKKTLHRLIYPRWPIHAESDPIAEHGIKSSPHGQQRHQPGPAACSLSTEFGLWTFSLNLSLPSDDVLF